MVDVTGTEAGESLHGDVGDDVIRGLGGNDRIYSTIGWVYSYTQTDYIYGGDGNDTVFAYGGTIFVDGGTGNDAIQFSQAVGTVTGGDGDDRVSIYTSVMTQADLSGGEGFDGLEISNLTLDAFDESNGFERLLTNSNSVTGTNDANRFDFSFMRVRGDSRLVIEGLGGDDIVLGADGRNQFSGGDGNDVLVGGAADDWLDGGTGDDRLDGGGGLDTVTYKTAQAGVTIDLNLSDAQDTGGGGIDTLISIETVYSTLFNDRVVGNESDNQLDDDGGDDQLFGRGGNDTIFDRGGNNIVDGGDGDDTLYARGGSQIVDGGDGDDFLYVSIEVEAPVTVEVRGGAGNDRISAQGGPISLIDGGEGDDFVSVQGSIISADLRGGAGVDQIYFGNVVLDGFSAANGFEVLYCSTYSPGRVMGTASDNVFDFSGLTLSGAGYGLDVSTGLGDDIATGSAAADYLSGGEGNDTLNGDQGADALYGQLGDDQLDGGMGDDILVGDAGDDLLVGGDGLDIAAFGESLNGVSVSLALQGAQDTGAGLDTLVSIEGLIGSEYADDLTGNSAANSLFGRGGDDVIHGRDGNDTIDGDRGVDSLFGGAGDDTITDGSAADQIYGGAGNDTIHFGGGGLLARTALIDAGDDDDIIEVRDVDLKGAILRGGEGVDSLSLSYVVLDSFSAVASGFEVLTRTSYWSNLVLGNDGGNLIDFGGMAVTDPQSGVRISGGGGDDRLVGSLGDDSLLGQVGQDDLTGGEGDDSLDGGDGDDRLNGGLGDDTADYRTAGAAVTVDLSVTTAQTTGGAGVDTLTEIENLIGGNFDDVLTGNASANHLVGGAGADTLRGAGGDDRIDGGAGDSLYGGDGNDSITVTLDGLTARVFGDSGSDVVAISNGRIAAANLSGGSDIDTISFNAVILDDFSAANGFEILGGAYAQGANKVIGSSTANVLDFSSLALADGTVRLIVDGKAGDDVITGGVGADSLMGDVGNDQLFGGLGDDLLNGGVGDDIVDGGAGSNTVSYQGSQAVSVDLRILGAQNTGSAGMDTIRAVENMIGSTSADRLIGDDQVNGITSGGGADSIYGQGGDDLITFASFVRRGGERAFVDGGDGNDQVTLLGGTYQDGRLQGGAGTDTINFVYAGQATPSLSQFSAANGFEVLGDGASGVASLRDTTGDDVLDFSSLTLASATSHLNIYLGRGNDSLIASVGDDLISVDSGNDTIDGSIGSDTVNYGGRYGVVVDLSIAGPQDTGLGLHTLISIENLIGSSDDDRLTGNDGNNRLEGGYGADLLAGGLGADVLDGGEEVDTASYATAGSFVVVNLMLTVAQNTRGAGMDTLISIENLTGSAFDDQLTGDSLSNKLSGGAGDDILMGGPSSLYPGAIDTLDGGAGFDIVRYSDATSGVSVSLLLHSAQDTGGGGLDRLKGIEGLGGSAFGDQLTGGKSDNELKGFGGADVLLGLGGDDHLFGGDGDDRLDGGAGLDQVQGGAGADMLTGGASADAFSYTFLDHSTVAEEGRDHILDFSHSQGDLIDLSLLDAVPGGADDAFTFIGSSAFSHVAGQLRVEASGIDWMVSADVDGDGAADFALLVTAAAPLLAADFLL